MTSRVRTGKGRSPLAYALMGVFGGSLAMTIALASITEPGAARMSADASNVDPRQMDSFHTTANEIMGLRRSDLITIDAELEVLQPLSVSFHRRGQLMTLDLAPHSVRAENFRVRVHVEDGSLVGIDPPPVNTFRGYVSEIPGTIVAASIMHDGLHAMIALPDDTRLWIEPLQGRVPGAGPTDYVLYDQRDADCEQGLCGVPDEWLPIDVDPVDGGIAGVDNCMHALLAVDADFQFYTQWGSSTTNVTNRVNTVVNMLNVWYESQLGIIHPISEIVIRTTDAPYNCTSFAGSYLNQFRNVWNSPPESQIPRAVAHLFTGCSFNDAAGIAWLGTVCQQPPFGQSYALSTNIGNTACMAHVVAHELGHNWNAPHCSCFNTIMFASFPPCVSTFHSSLTVPIILNFKNSIGCLTPCVSPVPNNECQDRIVVPDGGTPYSTIGATTEGPDEPELCEFIAGDSTIDADAWFEYTATCTGNLTVSLCDADYPSKLGIYAGNVCPTQPNTIIACDLASCPTNTRSLITIPVVEGETFIIRVGGRNDAQGEGTLLIECEEETIPEPECPADLNGDGVVDVFDLLVLLGDWGACPGCDADLNGNGVVDVFDLLILLGDWGACPTN